MTVEIILSNIISNIFCKQKKGIHRCTQLRLQNFLTYKEKLVHKLEHRTFIKPKELEGLPPGTKVSCVFFSWWYFFLMFIFGFFIFN